MGAASADQREKMPVADILGSADDDRDLNDLRMSPAGAALLRDLRCHIEENVAPISEQFFRLGEGRSERWSWAPGQLDLLEAAKEKARTTGLWNLFLSRGAHAAISNLDYAYIAAELGKSPLAAETINCSAPDTGNMEILEMVGSADQKARWLAPLLKGEIRSAYAMSEPAVASSDALNIAAMAELEGDEWVIRGEKYFVTGAGDPRCRLLICLLKTNVDANPKQQYSQILVPMDSPGLEILGPMLVFGADHAPKGHMHIRFNAVRVPAANILLGEGRGFEISQMRLGPGRIHHCMRTIGNAELALELMVRRGNSRNAFGKPLSRLGKNLELISRARCDIEAMRLLVLKAAKAMDVLGNREARIWVSMAKATIPERASRIIDEAIQLHGATGISQWTPLAELYTDVRHVRLADGPDEVHHMVVGRHELSKY